MHIVLLPVVICGVPISRTGCTVAITRVPRPWLNSILVSKRKYDKISMEPKLMIIMIMTNGWGLQQRPTSPITKIHTPKIKMDNEALQRLNELNHDVE